MAQALVLILAATIAGCSFARDYHAMPPASGKAACGVITVHKADGTTERHGRPCA